MISSKTNKFIAHIKHLNTSKKYRHQHYQLVLETERSILDTLTYHPNLIEFILATDSHQAIFKKAELLGLPVYLCNDALASHCAHVKNSAGCFAVINFPSWIVDKKTHPLTIAIENINNPANLGSILRNAHAFGCNALYRFGNSCDLLHPECVRASAGNMFSIPIYDLPEKDIEPLLNSYNCWTLDSNSLKDLSEIELTGHTCFIFGSEKGLVSPVLKTTKTCKIPMCNYVDSLNVAATSAIVLHKVSQLS